MPVRIYAIINFVINGEKSPVKVPDASLTRLTVYIINRE